MSKELARLQKSPLETMRDWSAQFDLSEDELLVLRLNTTGSDRATVLFQHGSKKLLAHEESQYKPNEKRGYDQEHDVMPFLTWGTWWFVNISEGVYQEHDFEDTDEGSIQGIVYALDAIRGVTSEGQRHYSAYIKSILKGDSLYGNIFDRAVPIDQALLDAIGIEELITVTSSESL